MYDFDELRQATDSLWAAIAHHLHAHGINAPAVLTRGENLHDLWTDPDLLLGQTCGYPLVTTLRNRVTLLATPRYTAPGCDGAQYRSAIIIHATNRAEDLADLRGARCAINDWSSNSGMNMLRAATAPLAGAMPFFGAITVTGSHAASARAVAAGAADTAAIDCITWAHLRHFRPESTSDLRLLAWTSPTPGLPLITSLRTAATTRIALLNALHHITRDPALAATRTALRLDGFETLSLSDYHAILPPKTNVGWASARQTAANGDPP
jgi:ABC-type phosphate/phosphonate transport system substrate-binding protein